MSCIGVYMDEHTRRALFNPELALAYGETVLTSYGPDEDPQLLRTKLLARLHKTMPHVTITFLDPLAELETDNPDEGDYALVIKQEAFAYSGSMH